MSSIKGTNVVAPVVPFDTADVYATHQAKYGRGGYRSVADATERDAITAERREAGMLVFTISDGKTWKLSSDLSSWTEYSAGGSSSSVAWAAIADKPSTFAPSQHTHSVADVSGLQSQLDGKQTAGSYAAAVHVHTVADVSGLQTAIDGKAATSHVHAIANVTGLQTALDSKQAAGNYAAASHTHTSSQVSDFAAAVVAAAPPTTNASLLTSGTVDAARLPAAVVLTTDSRLSDARTPLSHVHSVSDVTGLQTALDSKQAAGSYAAASHTHTASQVSGLASVATSGSYVDLLNKPTIPAATTSASDLTSGTLNSDRLNFVPIHPFLLMGG